LRPQKSAKLVHVPRLCASACRPREHFGIAFRELYDLWREPERGDEYVGTLVNACLCRGGRAAAVTAVIAYVVLERCADIERR
jgi:hypothetical protein